MSEKGTALTQKEIDELLAANGESDDAAPNSDDSQSIKLHGEYPAKDTKAKPMLTQEEIDKLLNNK